MNNKTLFYGLLAIGGVFAYYAWKKNSLYSKQKSQMSNTTTPLSHTSGVFVDDVPVDPKILGINTAPESFISNIKNSVSNIIEPLIGTTKQTKTIGQGEFADS